MTISTISNNDAIIALNFYKIIKDLIVDLNTSFGDKISVKIANNNDYQTIINYKLPNYSDDVNIDEYVSTIDLSTIAPEFFNSLNIIYEYCKGTFALRSIDILYQNEDMFLNKSKVQTGDTLINTVFLPDIDFAELYYDDTSSQTKQTLWKYLQVILFNIITSIEDVSFFGNSLELLKIIDSNKFSSKLESTIDELSKMFSFKEKKDEKDGEDEDSENEDSENEDSENEDIKNEDSKNEDSNNKNKNAHGGKDKKSNKHTMFPNIDLNKMFDISINNMHGLFDEMLNDLSSNFNNFENKQNATGDATGNATGNATGDNNNAYAIPDKDELFSHINKLINGKIGSLAKEIAEETTKNIEMENIGDMNNVNDVLKGFMKNPAKLLGLINNINNKISSKMKDGSLKESELLEEAAGIFKNMKNIPGMENFNDILKSMNMDKFMPKGGKINPNAFQNMMEQNVKMSKMRERMRKKAENANEKGSEKGSEKGNEKGSEKSSEKGTTKSNTKNTSSDNIKLDDLTANLSSLMNEMNNNTSFIDSIIKNQNNQNSAKQGVSRNNEDNSKRRENNKKKVNRKK